MKLDFFYNVLVKEKKRILLIEMLEQLRNELNKNEQNDKKCIENVKKEYKNIILKEADFFEKINISENPDLIELEELLLKSILYLKLDNPIELNYWDIFCVGLFLLSMFILVCSLIYASTI